MAFSTSTIFAAHPPPHCTPTSTYLLKLSSAFHTCVPTSLALLSTTLGICSIIAWLFAQVPQIYKNWRLQSASGLSIYFLLEWLAGDVTNLIGAVLTGQAGWQVGVATYYVIVDICLSGQYFWYTHVRPWHKMRYLTYDDYSEEGEGPSIEDMSEIDPPHAAEREEDLQVPAPSAESKPGKQPLDRSRDGSHRIHSSRRLDEKTRIVHNATTTRPSTLPSSRPLLSKAFLASSLISIASASTLPPQVPHPLQPVMISLTISNKAEFAGQIVSWMSTILYLGSRLPQIYKNAVRQSTAGLSPYMFLAAFCGNLFYSAAIIANPLAWASYPPYGGHGWVGHEGSDRFTWLSLAAPFWLGAAGVLALDATVGIQFLVYGDGSELEVLVEDREGHSRWKRVTGWMRGWVPNPSATAQVAEAEGEERPLLARRRSRSTGYGAA